MCPLHEIGENAFKAHESQLRVYRYPPASLFGDQKYPHQNFKIAKKIHYFQNIIVFTRFKNLKHIFLFIFMKLITWKRN